MALGEEPGLARQGPVPAAGVLLRRRRGRAALRSAVPGVRPALPPPPAGGVQRRRPWRRPHVRRRHPLLPHSARRVEHPQLRHRLPGGSITSSSDPASGAPTARATARTPSTSPQRPSCAAMRARSGRRRATACARPASAQSTATTITMASLRRGSSISAPDAVLTSPQGNADGASLAHQAQSGWPQTASPTRSHNWILCDCPLLSYSLPPASTASLSSCILRLTQP